jgi:hypothetical protein
MDKKQQMNNNNVFSKKSIKNQTQMMETPYWDNTNELVGGLVEEEDEEAKDEKGKPLQGLALLKRIYGSSKQEPKGGKRTAKEIKKFIEASYNEKNPPKEIEGFLLDTELSNKTAKVYHNPTTNETVIAHRGTQGITDWANNLAYVTGNYEKTDRYKKGKKNQKKAEAKYGAENISTLGHSQGAIIARKTGKNTKEIIGVNPASMGEKPLENEYNVRTSGDLVSKMLPSGKNVTTIKSKTSNPLTEHSAKNLKQIKNQEIGAGIKISYNDMNQLKGGRRRALGYSANDIDWINDDLLDEDDEMVGGDIFKSISKGAKKLGKDISKGSKKVGKDIGAVAKKGYQTINKTALKQDWGGYIETAKEPLLEVLEPVMSSAMEAVGVPAPVASTISASAVGSAKAVNFSKSLKGQGQKALDGAIHGAITGAVSSMSGGEPPEEGAGRRRMRGGDRPSNLTDDDEGTVYLFKGKYFVVIRGGNDEFIGFENGSTRGRQFNKRQSLQKQQKNWIPYRGTIANPPIDISKYADAIEYNRIENEIEEDMENGKYPNPKLHPKYERGLQLYTLFQEAIKEKEGEARRKMLEAYEDEDDEDDEKSLQFNDDGFNYDEDEEEEEEIDEEEEERRKKQEEDALKKFFGKGRGRGGVRYTKKGVPVSRAYQIVSAIEAKSVKSAKKLIDLQKMKNPSKYLQKKYGHVELEEAHPSGIAKPKLTIKRKGSASATKHYNTSDLYTEGTTKEELEGRILNFQKMIDRITHIRENVSKSFFQARYKGALDDQKDYKKIIDILKKRLKELMDVEPRHEELVEAHPSTQAKAKMVIAPRMAEQFIDQYQQAEDYDHQQEEEQTPAKKKYVRPQRGVKGARGKRGAQKKAKMTVEEQQASRKATLARERAKTISLSSEIRDVVKAIPTMNYLELMALKPTLIRFNNAERTKAEDNNLEKLKKAFNKRGEELKQSNQGRTQGMALARARDISDEDDVIEGFGRGKGLTNKIVKHLDNDNKEMKKLSKAFKRHMDTEEEADEIHTGGVREILPTEIDRVRDVMDSLYGYFGSYMTPKQIARAFSYICIDILPNTGANVVINQSQVKRWVIRANAER